VKYRGEGWVTTQAWVPLPIDTGVAGYGLGEFWVISVGV
jgi:hypothetical protein